MSKSQPRRNALRGLAAIVACSLASAQGATPTRTDEPNRVQVPHFGHGKATGCVPRARARIKAVMNDNRTAQFDNVPPSHNHPCQ
jgi:hypothetical protein